MKHDKFLVVLGLDSERKPHAAKFELADENAVRDVTRIRGFKIGHAKTAEAAELVNKLIDGKIFDSGRGLVPFVGVETYERLLKLLEITEPHAKPSTPVSTTAPVPSNDAWAGITVGSIVLCQDKEAAKDRSWWEVSVLAIAKDGKTLNVRWVTYPTLKPFQVKRAAVAILPFKV